MFGDEFRAIMDKIIEEYGAPPAADQTSDGKGQGKGRVKQEKKRHGEGDGPANKRLKGVQLGGGGSVKQIPLAEIGSEHVLLETDMVNQKCKGLKLHIKLGQKIYIINASAAPCKLPSGYIVAGFGKGSYKQKMHGETAKDKEVSYAIGPNSLVLQGATLTNVKTMVNTKQQQDPRAQIAYYEISEAANTDDPEMFEMKNTVPLVFVPTGQLKAKTETGEEGTEVLSADQVSAARLLPVAAWEQRSLCSLVWCVRWAPQGLMPVRPVVALHREVVIEPSHGVAL